MRKKLCKELSIVQLCDKLESHGFEVHLSLGTKRATQCPSLPSEGHIKYYVHCDKLSIYTTMGADNIHHASNKATKLWGPKWSKITSEVGYQICHQFVTVKQFGELLKTLQN